MDHSSSPKTCLICSTPNDSVRYGIDACRACASFYKRAQRIGRSLPCKSGKHQCTINRAAGLMCRGCRYDKCALLGMVYEGPIVLPSPNAQSQSEAEVEAASSIPSRPETLLERISREHDVCFERIRTQELSLARKHNLQRLPHPTEEIFLITFDFAIAAFNANIFNSWHFLQSVFPPLKEIPSNDQREFFRLCMPAFSLGYAFDRTKKLWGGFSKYMMFSSITCTDKEQPGGWFGMSVGGAMKKALLETMIAYSRNQIALVVPIFEKAEICDREMYALLPLILCESDMPVDFAERYQPFLERTRREILEDLHRFYTEEMGLSEYSTRLGNLMSLCHTFQEGSALFQQFFRMQVTVFDLYNTETLLQDLVL